MASPNVGKITVGVEFDTKGIEKQLTRDVAKTLIPVLEKYNQSAVKLKNNIDAINAKPLAEIAKNLNMVQKETSGLRDRRDAYYRAEKKWMELEAEIVKGSELRKKKAIAQGKATREINKAAREGRKADIAILEDLAKAEKALADAIDATAEAEKKKDNAFLKVGEKQAIDDATFERKVIRARNVFTKNLDLTLAETRKSTAAMVFDQINASQAQIAQATKVKNAQLLGIKAVADAQKKADQDAKRRRKDLYSLKAVRSTIGQIGRSLSGFSLGLSPAAFTTIVSSLALVAGGAAAASQALWLLPGAITAVGAAMVTLKVGMMGFSDTVSALVDGDLDKFDELIQKLSPNAQQAALTLQRLGPAFEGLKKSVQDALFKDSPQMIQAMTKAFMPGIEVTMKEIAASMNRVIGTVFAQLLTPETAGSLRNAMGSIIEAFRVLEPAAAPFTAAIVKLIEVGAAMLPTFADYLTKIAVQFNNFVQKNAENDNLTRWIEEGVAMIGEFWDLMIVFGKALYALAPIAEAVLPVIIDGLTLIADIFKEYPGLAQAAVVGFLGFKVLKTPIKFIIGLFKKGLPGGLANGLAAMGTLLSRFGTVITGIMGTAAGKALKAFLVPLKGLTGFFMRVLPTSVAAGLAKIGLLLAQFGTLVVGPLGVKIATAFAPVTAVLAAAAAGGWLANKLAEADFKVPDWIPLIGGYDNTNNPYRWDNPITGNGFLYRTDDGNRQPGAQGGGEPLGPIIGSDNNPVPVEVTELPQPDLPKTPLPVGTPIDGSSMGLSGLPAGAPGTVAPVPGSVLPDLRSMFPGIDWGTAEQIPVPASPVDERGNKIPEVTESDIRARIDADPRFDPRNFMPPDPYADINGIKNQPGWPGRPDLNVAVSNMPATLGMPGMAALPGMPGVGGPYPGDEAILSRIPKGFYRRSDQGGDDLTKGLADCSSSIEDLINIMDGLPTTGNTLNTFNAETELARRGFQVVAKPIPGAFNIGVDNTGTPHMQATLPGGTNFNWGFDGAAQAGGRQSQGAYDPRFQTSPTGRIYARMPGGAPGAPVRPGAPGMPPVPGAPVGSLNAMTLTDDKGVKPVMEQLAAYIQAQFPGLKLTSGASDRQGDGGHHPTGNAIDIAIPGDQTNDPKKLALAQWAKKHLGDYISELIYSDPGFSGNIKAGRPVGDGMAAYGSGTMQQHVNHVHIAIRDEMMAYVQRVLGGAPATPPSNMPVVAAMPGAPATPTVPGLPGVPGTDIPLGVDASGAPRSLRDGLYESLGPLIQDPATGDWGQMRTDNQRIADLIKDLRVSNEELAASTAEVAKQQQILLEIGGNEAELYQAQLDEQRRREARDDKQRDLDEARRGTFEELPSSDPRSSEYKIDFDKLPFGDPRKAMAAFIGGLGGGEQTIAAAVGLLGQPVGGAIADAGSTALLPLGTPTAPTTDPLQLARERNPAFFGAATGYDVPDYSRQGGGVSAQDLQAPTAPPIVANGAMTSDTTASIDRTMTNMDAANQAKLDQLLSIMQQVKTQFTAEVLGPIVEKSIAAGISGISEEALRQIGLAIGEAAGPVVAQAVKEALGESGTSETQPSTPAPVGRALGGPITGGTPGKDSVPALLMPGEFVLTTAEVQRMGGFAGVERFRAALANGSVQRFATGGVVGVRTGNPNGGQNVNSSVGADFFGVSQIPILAAAINALTAVLLQVIDVQIMARDSLIEVSQEFKDFRGEFKAFDASGRVMNNNAGLSDRTSSSEQQVANERIRILKLVLQGIINFLIEKIIVPISKALANAVISAFANGATAALGTFFPGSDILAGILSAAITAVAEVFIQIAADIFTIAAETFFAIGMEAIGELLQTIFPQLTTTFFSGAGLEGIVGPISQGLIGLTGVLTVAFGNLGGLFSGLLSGIAGAGPVIQTLLAGFTPLTATLSGLVGVLASILQALSILVGGIVNAGSTISASVIGTVTMAMNTFLGGFLPVVSGLNASVINLGAVNANIANLLGGFGALLTGVGGLTSIFKLPAASVNPASTPTVGPVARTIDSLVNILGNATPGGNTTTINAPITVVGAAVNTATTISNRLLALTR